jgi:hypothetical protein
MKTYHIRRAQIPYDMMHPRARFWEPAEIAPIDIFPWYKAGEKWQAFAQLLYDEQNLYFRMVSDQDHHIRAVSTEPNQPVFKDSTGELFVQPGPAAELGYFNLEINCVGTMLSAHGYSRFGRSYLKPELAKQVLIWHSTPGPTKEESKDDCCWEIEAVIPFVVMQAVVPFPLPAAGTEWRGNMYRCADGSSNPQYSMWNPIELEKPDYHRPEFFGRFLFL